MADLPTRDPFETSVPLRGGRQVLVFRNDAGLPLIDLCFYLESCTLDISDLSRAEAAQLGALLQAAAAAVQGEPETLAERMHREQWRTMWQDTPSGYGAWRMHGDHRQEIPIGASLYHAMRALESDTP